MTSPTPLDYYDPTCSYCWREREDPKNRKIMIRLGRSIHWVCSERCLKKMVEDYFEGVGIK